MKFTPYYDKVVVKPLDDFNEDKKLNSGLILPASVSPSSVKKLRPVVVVACGEGKITKQNKQVPLTVKPGDKVMIPSIGGVEVLIDGQLYLVIEEEKLLAIVED